MPEVAGAVYKPAEVMLPPLALQVTVVFVVPVIMAVNCCVAPGLREADAGEMLPVIIGWVDVVEEVVEAGLEAPVVPHPSRRLRARKPMMASADFLTVSPSSPIGGKGAPTRTLEALAGVPQMSVVSTIGGYRYMYVAGRCVN